MTVSFNSIDKISRVEQSYYYTQENEVITHDD